MKTPPSVAELCRRHPDEEAHGQHVARLAGRLFAAARAALELTGRDGALLAAAARLHDLAYAQDPASHPARGAALVLRRGIAAFTPAETEIIAAVIRLHSGAARAPAPRRTLALASLLRVADGLDHSHLQDAEIRRIARDPSGIRVRVRCAVYPGNAAWADRKADLWRARLPLGLRIDSSPPPAGGDVLAGVARPGDAPPQAARRLLCLLYRLIADHRLAALSGTAPDAVHDLRVSIRRFRAALRFYRGALRGAVPPTLSRRLAALTRQLSAVRDQEVWIAFLRDETLRPDGASEREARAWRRGAEVTQRRLRRRLRRILLGASCRRLLQRTAVLVRLDLLPGPAPLAPPAALTAYLSRRTCRLCRRILAAAPRVPPPTPEATHALRKRLRRARYYAEFAAPVLGRRARALAKRLNRIADALGDIHDADVHLARLARSGAAAPALLSARLAAQRRRAAKRYKRERRQLSRRMAWVSEAKED